MAGPGPHIQVQLPCQQWGHTESTVHALYVQLARKSRRLHREGTAGSHQAWLASGDLCIEWRIWVSASCESTGLGAGWARAECLPFLQPGRTTHTTDYKALGRGHAQRPPAGLQTLQNSKTRLKNVLWGMYLQEKERESSKEPFMNFNQTLCWLLLRPYSTEESRAERLEIGAAKGIQDPPSFTSHRSCHQRQAGKNWLFYTDWPLTWNSQPIHQKLHIIEDNLGQRHVEQGWEDTHTIFSEDWTAPPRREPGITLSQSHQMPHVEAGGGTTCSAVGF